MRGNNEMINKVLVYLKRDGLTGTRKKIRSYLYEQ